MDIRFDEARTEPRHRPSNADLSHQSRTDTGLSHEAKTDPHGTLPRCAIHTTRNSIPAKSARPTRSNAASMYQAIWDSPWRSVRIRGVSRRLEAGGKSLPGHQCLTCTNYANQSPWPAHITRVTSPSVRTLIGAPRSSGSLPAGQKPGDHRRARSNTADRCTHLIEGGRVGGKPAVRNRISAIGLVSFGRDNRISTRPPRAHTMTGGPAQLRVRRAPSPLPASILIHGVGSLHQSAPNQSCYIRRNQKLMRPVSVSIRI